MPSKASHAPSTIPHMRDNQTPQHTATATVTGKVWRSGGARRSSHHQQLGSTL
jgi:hypothetical protein